MDADERTEMDDDEEEEEGVVADVHDNSEEEKEDAEMGEPDADDVRNDAGKGIADEQSDLALSRSCGFKQR